MTPIFQHHFYSWLVKYADKWDRWYYRYKINRCRQIIDMINVTLDDKEYITPHMAGEFTKSITNIEKVIDLLSEERSKIGKDNEGNN